MTAVDHESGSALNKSLRSMEVIVPLVLQAEVSVLPGCSPKTDWPQLLQKALPLMRGLGSQRNRGLGQVTVTLEDAS